MIHAVNTAVHVPVIIEMVVVKMARVIIDRVPVLVKVMRRASVIHAVDTANRVAVLINVRSVIINVARGIIDVPVLARVPIDQAIMVHLLVASSVASRRVRRLNARVRGTSSSWVVTVRRRVNRVVEQVAVVIVRRRHEVRVDRDQVRRILARQRIATATQLTVKVDGSRGGIFLLHRMRARVQLRELGILGRVERGLGVAAGETGRGGRSHRALEGAVDRRGEDAEGNHRKDDKDVLGLHAGRGGGGRRGRVLWIRRRREEAGEDSCRKSVRAMACSSNDQP